MGLVVRGRAWKFGDNIDSDVIIPARYLSLLDYDEMTKHIMEPIVPQFIDKIRKGDLIISGRNFGCGSSREQAPTVLKHAGIGAIVAESFARIFFRNAINVGLPVVECSNISRNVKEGDELELDLLKAELNNLTTGEIRKTQKLPAFLLEILEKEGLIPYLQER